MTPEQIARYVLSDRQDPALRALEERECDQQLREAMNDPAFKARWDASMAAFAQLIDDRVLAWVEEQLRQRS